MKMELITENIWHEITSATKRTKNKSYVAVAYFGQTASRMLPLRKGSMLVVDASEKAVKSGQTCPNELIRLYRNGVKVYSYENLHAKVFIVGSKMFIGSANVSSHSSQVLQEVMLETTDIELISSAQEFIKSLCLYELGPERLKSLAKIYKPPKIGFGKKVSSRSKEKNNAVRLHVFNLDIIKYTDRDWQESKIGKTEAGKKRLQKERHIVDEFRLEGKSNTKEGDWALQIVHEGKKTYVSPPGTIINVRKWQEKSRPVQLVYVEIPTKKRKNITFINKTLTQKERKLIKRDGRKSIKLSQKIWSLWNDR